MWAAFRGACHIIIDCDGPMRDVVGFDPVGMPAREVFSEPDDSLAQQLMDRAYRTGVAQAYECPDRHGTPGLVVIVPLQDEDGVWGLTTLWRAHAAALHPALPWRGSPPLEAAS